MFKWWELIDIRTRANSLSDITVRIPNDDGQFSARFPNGTEVIVYLSWDESAPQIYWKGNTEMYTITKDKKSSFVKLWGRDKGKIFDDELTVNDDFNLYPQFVGSYGRLVEYMNNRVSAPLDLSLELADTDLDIVKDFDFKKTLNEIIDACQKGGYEWYFEGRAQTLVVRPPRTLVESNVVKTYVLGRLSDFGDIDLSNYALMKADTITIDSSDKITWVRFDGIEGISGIYPSTRPSILKEYYEQSDEWASNTSALQAATNKYNDNRFDRVSLGIEIPYGENTVLLGDVVKCDDSKYGLSTVVQKLYRVIEMNHSLKKKGGWTTSLGLGDFTPRITDFL